MKLKISFAIVLLGLLLTTGGAYACEYGPEAIYTGSRDLIFAGRVNYIAKSHDLEMGGERWVVGFNIDKLWHGNAENQVSLKIYNSGNTCDVNNLNIGSDYIILADTDVNGGYTTTVAGIMSYNEFSSNMFDSLPDAVNDKFIYYIYDLKTKGVVSGYSDGTFRPGNPVTRGEMAKFIVNAFNLGTNGNVQQFSDVPSTNPFFSYINVLKTEGIISGYSDGTYRPNALITRGETAKFITNAIQKRMTPPNGDWGILTFERFSDVPYSHGFYGEINFLAELGVIGGYSDGTFKPSNNVTRGEMSKMVSSGIVSMNNSLIQN